MLLLIIEQKRNWKCICFKNVDFPPELSSLCGFGNFILTVGLAKDKKGQKERGGGGASEWTYFAEVLFDIFIHFCFGFNSHLNFDTVCISKVVLDWQIDIFYLNHICLFDQHADGHHNLYVCPSASQFLSGVRTAMCPKASSH